MLFRLVLFLYCFTLLAGCGSPAAKKEAAALPLQAAKEPYLDTGTLEITPPANTFSQWCDYWLPFVAEYNGALVEIETIAQELTLRDNPEAARPRIAGVSEKLKRAENLFRQLPPARGLTKKHRGLLDQNTVKARAVLTAAQEIPPLLTRLAEHPEDTKTARDLSAKIKAANEITLCNENILLIRDDLLKNKADAK